MYSQNSEERIVGDYFNGVIGTLLDIGANDGKTLSNSLFLIEKGWSAVLVEPSPTTFGKLSQLHKGNYNVFCKQVAISDFNGDADFFESGEHLGNGDTSLLSSLDSEEIKRWRNTTTFEPIKVSVVDWNTFLNNSQIKKFDFISIDAEGVDITILKQMNLKELGCKCLIIEWNSIPLNKDYIDAIVIIQGYKLIHKNAENLIYAK